MDTQSLQAFLAVADCGSFSRAAEQLHLTQPAVSKRIAVLENQTRARLFDRIGRRVSLTEAGRVLLPRARQILVMVDDSRRALGNLDGDVGGELILATSHHIGLHRLPPILGDYVKDRGPSGSALSRLRAGLAGRARWPDRGGSGDADRES